MDLRQKPRLDYKQMNDGETILDKKEKSNRRNVLPELYEVERIISKKESPSDGTLET